jgi:sugar/nucleoside kinase (ribokinase family)
MSLPHLLGVGGAHIDRRGQVTATYVPGASNPGVLGEEVGGGVFNALRNARQRHVRASIISVRGGDMAGDAVARAIETSGISDLSAVFLDRSTPSYTALLDDKGDLIAGLADMGLYEMAFPKQIARSKVRSAIAEADAILCDTNVPAAGLSRLFALRSSKPVYAIAISPAKAIRLDRLLPEIACLFMNGKEAARLAGMDDGAQAGALATALRAKGLASGVITSGGNPVTGFEGDAIFQFAPPAPSRIVDVTGAGDALAGTTIAALMTGRSLPDALREGMAAAKLTIECKAVVANLAEKDFSRALALVPHAEEIDRGS